MTASRHLLARLLDDLHIVLFLHQSLVSIESFVTQHRPTFHISISSCLLLYCLTSSSSVFFKPSWFVCRIGTMSATVRSVSTPLIMRKHLRSPGSGSSVSRTSLWCVSILSYMFVSCRRRISSSNQSKANVLVLFRLLLDVTNLGRNVLQCSLVVLIGCLKLWGLLV